jgi:hypothetical protein
MRAFRPSQFAPAEEVEEDQQRVKDANVKVYAKRAEAGMPLFEGLPPLGEVTSRTSKYLARD